MGIKTSGAALVSLLNTLFEDLLHSELSVYLDDLLISTTTYERHLELLREVFTCPRKVNLLLGHKKCRFISNQATYLGHTIIDKVIISQEDKVKAVADYVIPQTAKQVIPRDVQL